MKILIDMNLAPAWRRVLEERGWETAHWSEIGDPRASDAAILDWARANGYVVLTHDLDFGAILAATDAAAPSVIQVRAQDVLPSHLGPRVADMLHKFESDLEQGALIIVDEVRLRVRVLPLRRERSP